MDHCSHVNVGQAVVNSILMTKRSKQLQTDWQRVLDTHAKWPKFSRGTPPLPSAKPPVEEVKERKAKYIVHGGTAKPTKVYTGTDVIGISVVHKSCLQPVFSQEQAEDFAKMRRG